MIKENSVLVYVLKPMDMNTRIPRTVLGAFAGQLQTYALRLVTELPDGRKLIAYDVTYGFIDKQHVLKDLQIRLDLDMALFYDPVEKKPYFHSCGEVYKDLSYIIDYLNSAII